jgi:predicted ABC-type ATPase
VTSIDHAVRAVKIAQQKSRKPLAIVLAGHNGSGKSTMWNTHLSPQFQVPLVNADRMMLSILPEPAKNKRLPSWAQQLRDTNTSWMAVAQKGVETFVAQALAQGVPFAMETVFSHWRSLGNGKYESKIDLIHQMQDAGYFVLLFFVGLSNVQLSIGRVSTREHQGGHTVPIEKLMKRFPRTQKAVGIAANVADATIFVDNSRSRQDAFTVCRVQIRDDGVFDLRRNNNAKVPLEIAEWLNNVTPTT